IFPLNPQWIRHMSPCLPDVAAFVPPTPPRHSQSSKRTPRERPSTAIAWHEAELSRREKRIPRNVVFCVSGGSLSSGQSRKLTVAHVPLSPPPLTTMLGDSARISKFSSVQFDPMIF